MRITKDINEANLITHAGKFHADDIFATALLSKIVPDMIIYRAPNFDPEYSGNAIIYDIGEGKFDHHQKDAKYRTDGVTKYASIGLLFEEYGRSILKDTVDIEEVFHKVDENLIKPIDAIDNGIFPVYQEEYKFKTLSDVINMYNPSYDEEEKSDEYFLDAVLFAITILDKEIKRANGTVKAREEVVNAIKACDSSILILERFLPYKEAILESTNPKAEQLKFIIFPSNRGGYTIQTLPIGKNSNIMRKYFPYNWCGLRGEALSKETNIEGATFCHTDGFIAACETLEGAIKMANSALD